MIQAMDRNVGKGEDNVGFDEDENLDGKCTSAIKIDNETVNNHEGKSKNRTDCTTCSCKELPKCNVEDTASARSKHHSKDEKRDVYVSSKVRSRNYIKWFVLIAGFFNHTVAIGFPFSLSVFYAEWLREFGRSNSETALVQSMCTGIFFIGGFLSGIAIEKYGIHQCGFVGGILTTAGVASSYTATSIIFLVLLLGVMCGFGLSLSYLCSSKIVGIHFIGRSKIMALAFITFGSGVGLLVFPILLETLITSYGWRGALLIFGGIMFNHFVSASIFMAAHRNPNGNKDTRNDGMTKMKAAGNTKYGNDENSLKVNKEFHSISVISDGSESISKSSVTSKTENLTDIGVQDKLSIVPVSKTGSNGNINERKGGRLALFKAVLLNKLYLLFTFACALTISTFASLFIFLIDYLQSKGLSRNDAIMIYTYMNVVNMVARLLPGLLKQIPHVSTLCIPVIGTFLACISAAAFPLVGSTYSQNLVAAFCLGFVNASMISSITICMVKIIGQDHFTAGLGIAMTVIGIFQLIAGPMSGYIRDTTGNYDASFFSASASFFIAFTCFLISMVYRHNVNRNKHSRFVMNIQSVLPWKKKSVNISKPV